MTIASGTRLGPYEILAPLGAGGMGEVWKARDTRLERSVAIKVLPADFAENAQLKLRFEREAKTISQLNHPHICTLYDVGDGYLVMELLEGESLADRLAKGPLPIEQVLRYGIQIAEALEKAHKAGIVHRDLKPGNIMITKSGAKLLDFGLAKPAVIFNADGATQHKPLTQEGSIVGTFQYMAPEQIEGGEIDARTDIFALGAVLYEMATGRRAFSGKSKASLIASILTVDPQPISAMQPMTPATFDRVVRTCLEKDPDARWQSAHDIATELRWVADNPAVALGSRAKRQLWPWIIAAALAIVLGGVLWRDRTTARDAPIVRTAILPPDHNSFDFMNAAAPPSISPDGSKIVFGAAEPGKPRILWLRSLESLVAQPLAGTENALFPFWSPDGRFIAFFADNALKKMEVSGGAPVIVCPTVDGRGGSWSPDGHTIVFAGRFTPLMKISAAGGTPVEITNLSDHAVTHRWPEFLPDGRHVLFLSSPTGNDDPLNTICIADLEQKTFKPLITSASDPHHLNGSIIFSRDHILTAQQLNLKTLALQGDAVPLKEQQVELAPVFSKSMITIAQNGTLVYQTGRPAQPTQLTWFDRSGKILRTVGEPAQYVAAAIAPDEKSVLTALYGPQVNIWQFDLVRGARSRITFNTGFDTAPAWSPDGRRVAYTSIQGSRFRLMMRDLATGAEEVLVDGSVIGIPAVTSWSADGQRIMYAKTGRATRADIWWLSLADRKEHVYLQTSFPESGGRFSPDGKWVAYQSAESGSYEVYIAPFPPTGAKWQVSTNGGAVPRWRGDGQELFFASPGTGRINAVSVKLGVTPEIGRAVPLFEFQPEDVSLGMYDVTRDGQRFLCKQRVGDPAPPGPLNVVQHFDREVRAALEHRE